MSQKVPGADGQREPICGSLNKNGLHKLIGLNDWSPVSKAFWEGLKGVALLEEMCHLV